MNGPNKVERIVDRVCAYMVSMRYQYTLEKILKNFPAEAEAFIVCLADLGSNKKKAQDAIVEIEMIEQWRATKEKERHETERILSKFPLLPDAILKVCNELQIMHHFLSEDSSYLPNFIEAGVFTLNEMHGLDDIDLPETLKDLRGLIVSKVNPKDCLRKMFKEDDSTYKESRKLRSTAPEGTKFPIVYNWKPEQGPVNPLKLVMKCGGDNTNGVQTSFSPDEMNRRLGIKKPEIPSQLIGTDPATWGVALIKSNPCDRSHPPGCACKSIEVHGGMWPRIVNASMTTCGPCDPKDTLRQQFTTSVDEVKKKVATTWTQSDVDTLIKIGGIVSDRKSSNPVPPEIVNLLKLLWSSWQLEMKAGAGKMTKIVTEFDSKDMEYFYCDFCGGPCFLDYEYWEKQSSYGLEEQLNGARLLSNKKLFNIMQDMLFVWTTSENAPHGGTCQFSVCTGPERKYLHICWAHENSTDDEGTSKNLYTFTQDSLAAIEFLDAQARQLPEGWAPTADQQARYKTAIYDRCETTFGPMLVASGLSIDNGGHFQHMKNDLNETVVSNEDLQEQLAQSDKDVMRAMNAARSAEIAFGASAEEDRYAGVRDAESERFQVVAQIGSDRQTPAQRESCKAAVKQPLYW